MNSLVRKQTEHCPADNSASINLKVCVVKQADNEGQRFLNNPELIKLWKGFSKLLVSWPFLRDNTCHTTKPLHHPSGRDGKLH